MSSADISIRPATVADAAAVNDILNYFEPEEHP